MEKQYFIELLQKYRQGDITGEEKPIRGAGGTR